jgi:hypothetical protein
MSKLPTPKEVADRGVARLKKAREKEVLDKAEQERREAEQLRQQYLVRTGRKEMKP